MAGLNLVFICAVVDPHDPIQAATVRWIERLGVHPQVGALTVLALRRGRDYDPPPGVTVQVFQGSTRLGTVVRFYRAVAAALRRGARAFLIYQGGPYPVMLLPIRLFRRRLYQWKAHPEITRLMWFSARFCDTKVFTSTPSAFPLRLPNVRVVGQGVDVRVFRPSAGEPREDFVTVGRIAPVKNLGWMIRLLAAYNRRFAERRSLHFYGPILARDQPYRQQLENLSQEEGVWDLVEFRGPVLQESLPQILSGYRVFLSFNRGALDRAVVEAMSCGLPVMTDNVCVAEILPASLQGQLILPAKDLDAQAARLRRVIAHDDPALRQEVRKIVVQGHSLDGVVNRIIGEIVG